MRTREFRKFVGDFETTVYAGQTSTEVWASAVVEIGSEDVKIFHSIDETFSYFESLRDDIIVYYHNLKFDGSFWLDYLLTQKHLEQSVEKTGEGEYDVEFTKRKDMPNNSFQYCISEMGQWYSMVIKIHNRFIEIRDSLKLLPFSVKKIGSSFGTKHKKLDMEYTGYRYAGCIITDEERRYIANDVLVVKEALEIMFGEGHESLTIGSCCLKEYRKILGEFDYKNFFPDLREITLDDKIYGSSDAEQYIRHAYKGGWCYVVRGKENQIKHDGVTADVNSLYPSMMSSESGNHYPVGKPTFWVGDIPDEALGPNKYYFVRIRTKFALKKNMLPCIQIKGNLFYNGTEWLETSNIKDKDGNYYDKYYDDDNVLHEANVILTLTMTDFQLIQEHYELYDFIVMDGCWFWTYDHLFDEYIDKYKKLKIESTGARRELAKLFLNNLYGKMATSPDSSFKYAYIKDDGNIGFAEVIEYNKKPVAIQVGAAITSYARNFTIRAAQKNYYGPNERGFIYADTDSIHCDLLPEEVKGITVHPKNFCCWKLESTWDIGYFVRQKTYIEHVVAEDLEKIEHPYYNIKCAGLPEQCKYLFLASMEGRTEEQWKAEEPEVWNSLKEDERQFIIKKRDITDFKVGLCIPSKLITKRIKGGILLVDSTYEMR